MTVTLPHHIDGSLRHIVVDQINLLVTTLNQCRTVTPFVRHEIVHVAQACQLVLYLSVIQT